jgi:pentapeptide MXKDX repeat protein
MKPTVALALSLLALPLAAQAPQKVDPHAGHGAAAAQPSPAAEVPKWMRTLDMTPAQRQEIARIHHDAHAKMDAAKKQWAASGKSPDKDPALKAEMQKMMDAEHAAFRAALSPAAQPAYDAALKAHMGAEHGAAGAATGGMSHEGMKHDGMKHDGMKHDGMKHDGMKADGAKAGEKPGCCKKGEAKPPASR